MNDTMKSYLEVEPGPWVWALGDGLEGGWNCTAPVKIRRAFWGDPAASLAVGEVMPEGIFKASYFRAEAAPRRETFERLARVVGRQGVFARANAKQDSAFGFAARAAYYGIKWPVARTVAKALAGKEPFPIFFTHRRMPLFRDEEHRLGAMTFSEELLAMTGSTIPTWQRPEWGMGLDDDPGGTHYLTAVLRLVYQIDELWEKVSDQTPWQEARLFLKATRFAEQVFGGMMVKRVIVT